MNYNKINDLKGALKKANDLNDEVEALKLKINYDAALTRWMNDELDDEAFNQIDEEVGVARRALNKQINDVVNLFIDLVEAHGHDVDDYTKKTLKLNIVQRERLIIKLNKLFDSVESKHQITLLTNMVAN